MNDKIFKSQNKKLSDNIVDHANPIKKKLVKPCRPNSEDNKFKKQDLK